MSKEFPIIKIWRWVVVVFMLVSVAMFYVSKQQINRLEAENKKQQLMIFAHDKQIPFIAEYITLVKELEKASQGRLSAFEITEIAQIVLEQCKLHSDIGLRPSLIMGLIERESRFDPDAVSIARAYGLTQIIRSTAELHLSKLGYGSDFNKELVLNPLVNVQLGIAELIRLRKAFLEEGVDDWTVILTAYFWGWRNTWSLLSSKKRARLPSLEYGHGVLKLSKKWQARGIG